MPREAAAVKRMVYACASPCPPGAASTVHVFEIVRGLRSRGWSVDLVYPSYLSGDRAGALVRLLGIIATNTRAAFRLPRADVLYCRSHFGLFPLAIIARLARVPVVQEVNGPYADVFLGWPLARRFATAIRAAMRWQLAAADLLIAVTSDLAVWLRETVGHAAVVVIPNGADTEHFAPTDRREEATHPYVLFFGRLTAWQGIDTLLDAVLRPEWPASVELVVAGDGPQRSRVESCTKEGSVRYVGQVARADLPSLVRSAIATISPQGSAGGRNRTGLSALKVYESLACGTPVIASAWPGHQELIQEVGCGILFPPDDASALAAAVRRCVEDPVAARAMGARGSAWVRRHASWDVRAQQTHDALLHELPRADAHPSRGTG